MAPYRSRVVTSKKGGEKSKKRKNKGLFGKKKTATNSEPKSISVNITTNKLQSQLIKKTKKEKCDDDTQY